MTIAKYLNNYSTFGIVAISKVLFPVKGNGNNFSVFLSKVPFRNEIVGFEMFHNFGDSFASALLLKFRSCIDFALSIERIKKDRFFQFFVAPIDRLVVIGFTSKMSLMRFVTADNLENSAEEVAFDR